MTAIEREGLNPKVIINALEFIEALQPFVENGGKLTREAAREHFGEGNEDLENLWFLAFILPDTVDDEYFHLTPSGCLFLEKFHQEEIKKVQALADAYPERDASHRESY